MPLYPIIQNHIKAWYKQKLNLVSNQPIEVARQKLMPLMPTPKRLHLDYEDHSIQGNFQVRLFRPQRLAKTPSPYVIFIRASGYCMGTIDHHNLPCGILAEALNCVVIGLEHRLAPEYKFPIPLNDCEQATLWIHKHAQRLGLDNANAAIIGECSGGNICASLNHRFAKRQDVFFKRQLLLYPTLSNHKLTSSKQAYAEGYITDLNMLDFTMRQYLHHQNQRLHHEVSPSLQAYFEHLPPTEISIGEYDMFKDEALEYCAQLQQANIQATCAIHPKLIHGFIRYYLHLPEVRDIIEKHLVSIKRDLHLPISR